MGWLAAGLGLAAANLCLYAAFAVPYAARFGTWLDGALLAGGAAAFLLGPLLVAVRAIGFMRRRGTKVAVGRVLLASLFYWNLAAAAAVGVLTPRSTLIERAHWLPARLEARCWTP
ncbi:MAG: hypothetical protein FD126_988, partial [Elusimicrobia bacterium]